MRIAILITKGELGGAQTHVLELCRALAGRCEFMAVIGSTDRSALGDQLAACGVEVRHVPSLANSLSPLALARSVAAVRPLLRQWRPDAVHLHSAAAGVAGRLAAALEGIPAVYTVHGFAFKPEVPLARRTVAFLVERLLAPLTHRLICVSDHERSMAGRLRIPAQRIALVFNGIADSRWRADPGAADPAVVMVARAAAPKRHDLLLQALAVLRERGLPAPRSVLAGGGPGLAALAAQAGALGLQRVEMAGDVADVPQLLARCQVFVLLSDHEGQPISVIEAMRAGLPVLASDLPGIRGQLSSGQEGLLVSNTPEAVADALQALLSDPGLRRRMGAAARQRYERQFHVRAMAGRVADIYSNLSPARPDRKGVPS